ncbi:unnamed protein product [Absidia cylindrospora]
MIRFSVLFIFYSLISCIYARYQMPPLASACEAVSQNYLLSNCTQAVYYTPECQCNSYPWLGSMALCISSNAENDTHEQQLSWNYLKSSYCGTLPDSAALRDSMQSILANATKAVTPLPTNPATDILVAPIHFPRKPIALVAKSVKEFNDQLQYGLNYGGASCALVFGFVVLGMLNNLFHHFVSWRYLRPPVAKSVKPKSLPASPTWVRHLRRHLFNPSLFFDGVHLQSASWFGILVSYPTRLESFMIFLFVLLNIILLFPNYGLFMDNTFWPNDITAQVLRYVGDRSGEMSFAQLPMVYLFGGRNNILIWLTGWSYDRFIVAHKWSSRVMMLHAIVHTIAYTWYCGRYGYQTFIMFFSDPYLIWGVSATLFGLFILLLALPNLRRSCYDFFLYTHIALVLIFTLACWYHVYLLEDVENMMWLILSMAVWAYDRVARLIRVVYYNIMLASGQKWLRKVKADIIPGTDCIRFRVDGNKHGLSHRVPGVFVYIYVPEAYFWQSHPFTIASWNQPSDRNSLVSGNAGNYGTMAITYPTVLDSNKFSRSRSSSSNTFDLLIRPQQGMTKKLYDVVEKLGPEGGYLDVLIEGPYGHSHPLLQYDTAILVGGGVGCTAIVPYLQEAVYNMEKTATRHVVFIWVVQYDDQLLWAQNDIQDCLAYVNSKVKRHQENIDESTSSMTLDLSIFVTRSTRVHGDGGKTTNQKKLEGWDVSYGSRPNLDKLLGQYVETSSGSSAILHCGPDRMSDQIRQISACHGVPYFEEAFNW